MGETMNQLPAYAMRGTYPLTANSTLQCRMDGAEEMARTAWAKSIKLGTPGTGYFVGPGRLVQEYRDLASSIARDALNTQAKEATL